jgi:hypothetical protein
VIEFSAPFHTTQIHHHFLEHNTSIKGKNQISDIVSCITGRARGLESLNQPPCLLDFIKRPKFHCAYSYLTNDHHTPWCCVYLTSRIYVCGALDLRWLARAIAVVPRFEMTSLSARIVIPATECGDCRGFRN